MSPNHGEHADPQTPCGAEVLDPVLTAADLLALAQQSLPVALKFTSAEEAALCVRHQNDTQVFSADDTGSIHRAALSSEPHSFYACLETYNSSGWTVHQIENKNCTLKILLKGASSPLSDAFTTWSNVLFLKAQTLSAQEFTQLEHIRYARWFKTLDGQLRVLERERQKLAMLVNKTESGAVVFDADHKVRWVNPAMAKRFGMETNPSALTGQHCSTFCGSAKNCTDCPITNVLKHKKAFHHERTQVTGEETRHYYISAFPLLSPSAQVDEVLVTIQDLTDLETLRKSEARYNTLFQRSADAIFMANTGTFEIIMANKQAQNLTGNSEDELRTQTLLDLHPENNQDSMRVFYQRLADGATLDNVEVEVKDGEGHILTCNLCGTLFDLDGQQVVQVEYRDVTQMRVLQQELARADHLITLGTMNAGIAHEFKNRLAPLRAFAQMLTLKDQKLDRLLKYGPIIVNEVDRLSNLIGDVLDYAGPKNPTLGEHNLGILFRDLVNELTEEYRPRLEEANIDVRSQIPENICALVHVDADHLRRVYINLFKNSVEACESTEGRRRSIEIGMEANRETVSFHMTDTGCGIPEDSLKRIFDPFFSTKGPKGTGLGMCIVKSLVETNSGTIDISSVHGQGTTVCLTFKSRYLGEQAA